MSARPVIQTYRLASLHEAAIARLKNPKNDRYKELYLQNRGIGEKVYNAVLSGRLDLACFCGDSSKYYSVLTRSTRQDGALQVTEIDRKGPIGHRLLTGPKQLELPGCGATVAAVSDVSRCTEQEILDVVGLFDEIHKPNKTFRSVIRLNPCAHLLQIGRVCRDELLRKQVQVLEMAKLVKEQPRAEGNAIIIRDIDFLML